MDISNQNMPTKTLYHWPLSHHSFFKFWVSTTCSSRTFCSCVCITFAIEGLQIIGLCSGLWAGRDLYHITLAVTQGQLSSCGLILYDHNNLKAFHNKDISTWLTQSISSGGRVNNVKWKINRWTDTTDNRRSE